MIRRGGRGVKHVSAGIGLAELFNALAERHAQRPAFIVGDAASDQMLTFADLHEQASRLAAAFSACGFRRGDRLAVWLPNLPEWLVLQVATAQIGICVAAINTRFRSEELRHILATCRPRGIVFAPGFLQIDFAGMLAQVLADADVRAAVELLITVGGEAPAIEGIPTASYAELIDAGATADIADTGRPQDLSILFPTSGTTSLPKLAAHDQSSIVAHAESVARALELQAGDRMLCPLPLCGVFGFSAVFGALAAGAAALTQTVFDGPVSALLAERHQATHFVGTDPMLQALITAGQPQTLRRGICSILAEGPAEMLAAAEERLGVRMSDVYGSSECFALLAFWSRDAPAELRAVKGGTPVSPEIKLRIVDTADGHELGPGEQGELQIRGYNVLAEYLQNPAATERAFTPDGWYRTGDLAFLDDEGRLFFLTRLDDSLRLHGFLVSPGEIEMHLERHHAVAAAQVVGIKDQRGNDVPVAFARIADGASCSVEELQAFCRGRIAAFKVPARIWFVDDFPRTTGTNGAKVQRSVLRQQAAELFAATPDPVEAH